MAELTPIEKLKIIEDDFQKWFRKAYELKDYTDVDIDYIVANLPDAKLQMQRREGIPRYLYYATQFKSTIKVPPQFQDTPKLFINALGKYFVDSTKFFYKDQIRYEYLGFFSSDPGEKCNIAVYKSCADEVGCFIVEFHLEGNLVVAVVGYQIFGQMMPLRSPPDMLKAFNQDALSATSRDDLLNSVSPIRNGSRYFLCCSLFLIPMLFLFLGLVFFNFSSTKWSEKNDSWETVSNIMGTCSFLFLPVVLFFGIPILNRIILEHNREKKDRLYRREIAIQQDLSPIHFPVKYFNSEDFNDAFTKSHDHQIFFKQLQEVVNRMSALGESSNS